MTLFADPAETGFVVRLWRVYREKRRKVDFVGYNPGGVGVERLRWYEAKLPRRAALRVAWRQARNARRK